MLILTTPSLPAPRPIPKACPKPEQSINDRYDRLQVTKEDRLRRALKSGAIGAVLGAALPSLAIPLALLTKDQGALTQAVQMTVGAAAGLGVLLGGAELLLAPRGLQQEFRQASQQQAVALARSLDVSQSPTAKIWSDLESLTPISTAPGFQPEAEPHVLAILRSLQERGTEFEEDLDPTAALKFLQDGRSLKLRHQGERNINSLQGLLAFDVTRGAGLAALPARIKKVWDSCEKVDSRLTGAMRHDPRDAMERVIAEYAGPDANLPFATPDLRTYSDVEHFDYLEKGGPAPHSAHSSLGVLERLQQKGFTLLSKVDETVWPTPAFDTYRDHREQKASLRLLDTPAGRIPIWAGTDLETTIAKYENIGLQKLAENYQRIATGHRQGAGFWSDEPEVTFLRRFQESENWSPSITEGKA